MPLKRHRLAQRRKTVGHSQESLAEKLSVDRTTVVRWERGESAPQPWVRLKLAEVLDITVDQLNDLLSEPKQVDASTKPLRVAPGGNAIVGLVSEAIDSVANGPLLVAAPMPQESGDQASGVAPYGTTEPVADLIAVYPNRAELTAHMPADRILDGARDVRAMGLSLNLLCQYYPDRCWNQLIEDGARVRCLFLDPDGSAIRARELEEGFPTGHLAALTKLNIETMLRVRDRLPGDVSGSMEVATYDETLRFNVILVDDLCLAQPYLPASRGVDSPTFVMQRRQPGSGLYPVYEQVFDSQWERGRRL